MGGCVTGEKVPNQQFQDPKIQILKKAYKTFIILDKNKNDRINMSDIQLHFGAYSQASAKIMLRQIDMDNDGIIKKNDWLGYWQLVRRAGYRPASILQQLNNIEQGKLTLNFPDVNKYKQQLPRSTVVSTIVDDLKRSPPQQLPFSLEK